MPDTAVGSPRFWETVSEHVTIKVERARNQKRDERTSVILYLRDLEAVARLECRCRDTIQIIAAGRHLLGDRDELSTVAPPRAPARRSSRARNPHHEPNLNE